MSDTQAPTVEGAIEAIKKAVDHAYEDGTFIVDGLTYGHLPIGPALMLVREVERLQRDAITSDSIARDRGWLDPQSAAALKAEVERLRAIEDQAQMLAHILRTYETLDLQDPEAQSLLSLLPKQPAQTA
jgi:hypothetical protein